MSLVATLAVGGAIGVRHALETDHLAAVATLVEGDAERSPALVGASWGIGHSLPIVALGLLFVVLGVRLPAPVTAAVEGLVGVVLVALGARMLLAAGGEVDRLTHRHGTGATHRHLQVGHLSLGSTHLHLDGDSALVGAVHGLAGSGALVVAMVAASPTTAGALGVLAGFSLLSICTMALISLVWGWSLETGLRVPLEVVAGLAGIAVGLLLVAEVVGIPI